MKKNLPLLLVHVCVSVVLATVVGFACHSVLVEQLEAAQREHAQAYIPVRAAREQRLFDDALLLTRTAERTFRRRLHNLSDEDIGAEFDRLFPLRDDGTRRSAPELFDGFEYDDGDYVYGMGAFLAEGGTLTMDEKRIFLAAYHTVRTVGDAHINRFTSLYFFTPDRQVVIFGPERDDRLEFYRIHAPADFDLRGDEDAALFDPATNPHAEMQCTRLSRFLYNDEGERAATSCRLPIRRGEELLGAFGSSIMMNEYLARTLDDPPPHGVNMLFDAQGNVIARGDVWQNDAYANGDTDRIDPNRIMDLLRADPRPHGVFRDPYSPHLVAYSRLDGPGWYFVSYVPLRAVHETAREWAWSLFWLSFLISILVASGRWLFSRLKPLRRLHRKRAASPAFHPRPLDPAIQLGSRGDDGVWRPAE